MSDFHDLAIVGLDEEASRPTERGSLFNVILNLSENAPPKWSQMFDHFWRLRFYSMKRAARVYGDRLEIVCVPEEIEKYHLTELKKTIGETNQAYRAELARQEKARLAAEEKVASERRQLSDLKARLKFD